MANKLFFSIEFVGGKATIDELAAVELELSGINKQLAAAKKAGDGDTYKKLRLEQENLKKTAKDLRAELVSTTREFEKAKFPTDSIVGMEHAYASLRREIREMSAEARNSAAGLEKINFAAKIKNQIDVTNRSFGDFKSSIGDYKSAFSGLGDLLTGGLATGGPLALAAAGIELASDALARGKKDITEYETALKNLSAILGLTGDQLAIFEKAAVQLEVIEVGGEKIISTGKDIFEAFKLVGSAQPELLKSEAALQAVAKSAIVLQKAAGGELNANVEAITTTLAQFNLEAAQSDEVINVLAAGSKEGAAEIEDLTKSTKEFGVVASINNVSLNDSVAILEVLADKQLKGERAGIQLRNVLTTLASVDILPPKTLKALTDAGVNMDIISDKTLSFGERLKELQKLQGDTATTAQVFGKENLAAASILINSGNRFEELSVKIAGTQEAYKQAAIQADTLEQKQKNLDAAVTNFFTSEGAGGTEILKAAYEALTDALLNFQLAITPLQQSLGELRETFDQLAEAIGVDTSGMSLLKTLTSGFGAVVAYVTQPIKDFIVTLEVMFSSLKNVANFITGKKKATTPTGLTGTNLGGTVGADGVSNTIFSEGVTEVKAEAKAVEEAKKTAADKEAERLKKENDKRIAKQILDHNADLKRIQEQETRIAKLKEQIAELSAKEINNIFDKQIADAEAKAQKQLNSLEEQKNKLEAKIKAQGGNVRGSDLTESGLIDQETSAIKSALDNQKAEIEKKRQEAFDAARAQLQKLQDENLRAIEANSVAVAEASLTAAKAGFDQEEAALKTSLDKGLITHKAYGQMLLELQKRRAEEELSIRENLLAERHAQLQLELQLELKHIDQVSAERKKAAQDDFNAGKVDAQTLQQQLLAIDVSAAEQKEAIMISTSNKEKALIDENKNAQLEANKEIDAANKAVNDAELERQKKLAEQKKAIGKEISDALFNIAGQLSDAIFDINSQQAEKEKEIATTNLEDTYAKRIELAEGNATVQEALAKELEAKKLALDKEAFEENKKRQISQAVINGLLAIVQSLANTALPFPASLIAPGVIATTTAIQIAKIKGTTFAKGGFTGKGHGAPDHTGEIPVGVVHGDEYVVDKNTLKRNKSVVDWLERDRLRHLRGFADGGFTSDIIPQTVSARSFLTPNTGGFTSEMANEIAEKVYQATLAGSLEGSKRGTALGNDERNRLLEREKAAKINNTF
jgi:TP901 family phage tail tape measure protein